MIKLWMILGAFVGGWAGWSIVAKRKGQSATVVYAGGFLAGFLMMAAVMSLVVAYGNAPLPKSLREAGLIGVNRWSPEQMALAAKVSAREMKDIDTLLHELSRKGDAPGAVALFDRTIEITRAWNEQASAGALGARRDCQLAAAHLSEGVLSVSQGGFYHGASRFSAAAEGCQ